MRKMIMMAIAGYLWKKFQSRGGARPTHEGRTVGRY